MNFERQTLDFIMSIAFSIFGMLLIFGLGFIFPTVDPYIVIKWIVIVAASVFLYSVLSYFGSMFSGLKSARKAKKGGKK